MIRNDKTKRQVLTKANDTLSKISYFYKDGIHLTNTKLDKGYNARSTICEERTVMYMLLVHLLILHVHF